MRIKPTMSHALNQAHLNELLVNYYEDLLKDNVVMPKELTAENGGKSIFMGEFKEVVGISHPEYFDEEDAVDEDFDEYINVTIGWDTIKSIYALAVKRMAT